MANPMECHCIPQRELPQTTRLFATFLDDFPRVAEFFAHPPNEEGITRAAAQVRQELESRRTLVEILASRTFASARMAPPSAISTGWPQVP